MRQILVVLTALLMMITACAGPAPEVPVGADGKADPVLVLGRGVYSETCKRCHGSTGDGGSGPKLNNSDFDEDFPELSDVVERISEGRRQMPAFSPALTMEQIEAVARYVREVL